MFIIYFIIFLPIMLICLFSIVGGLKLTNTMLNTTNKAMEETLKEMKNNK